MKVLLIAGHGANDPGATSTIGGITYKEATETRILAALIAEVLGEYATVETYDVARNAYYDHQSGKLPNLSQYDYVLEIHFNAFKADAGDGKTKGVEIFSPSSRKTEPIELAIIENIAKLGLKNRGAKFYNWAVISQANMHGTPASLLEVCFIDDADDMAVYLKDKQAFSQAVCDAFVEAFGLEQKEDDMKYYKYYKDIPDWGKPTVKKLMDKGYLKGDGLSDGDPDDINLEHNCLKNLVLNDRAGLYD